VEAAQARCARDAAVEDALIDWPNAARQKLALLRALFEDFTAHELTDPVAPRAAEFHAFAREGGKRLREHALFEALHAHWLAAARPQWDWRTWPAEWRAR